MIGAVLAATDPAILIPLFERLRLRPKVAQTVIAESAFNDPTGTVLTLDAGVVVTAGSVDVGGPTGLRAEPRAGRRHRHRRRGRPCRAALGHRASACGGSRPAAAILAVVAAEYFASEEIGGSGYLAAFVMGLVVGNMDLLRLPRHQQHFAVLEGFAAQAADVAILAVFVTLGLNLPLDALWDDLGPGLLVMAVFIFVARPLTVFACLLPDRRGALDARGAALPLLVPRDGCRAGGGRGPAAVPRVPGAEQAVTMVAFAIVTTLLLQATTAGLVARRLGLLDDPVARRRPRARCGRRSRRPAPTAGRSTGRRCGCCGTW